MTKKRKIEKVTSTNELPTVTIGDLELNAFGLGTLPLGVDYPEHRPSESEAIRIIHTAIDAGCQFFDTADTYGRDGGDLHYVEKLVGRAIVSHPDQDAVASVRVATKGSMVRINAQSNGWRCGNVRPDRIKSLIRASHEALNEARVQAGLPKKPIFLWQLHHVDSSGKSIDQLNDMTVEAMKGACEMVREGLVEHLGLCNATVAQVTACHKAGIPLKSLQNLFSPFRGSLTASKPLPVDRKAGKTSLLGTLKIASDLGLCFMAHGALGGLNARRGSAKPWPEPLVKTAMKHGVSIQALALAVMRLAHPNLLSIPGARQVDHARDSVESPPKIAISDSEYANLVKWI